MRTLSLHALQIFNYNAIASKMKDLNRLLIHYSIQNITYNQKKTEVETRMNRRKKEKSEYVPDLSSALVLEQRCHDWSYLVVRFSAKLSFEIFQNKECTPTLKRVGGKEI